MSKNSGKRYEYLYRPDHPLSSFNGFVSTHRLVLFENIGPGTHHCHWCGDTVTWRTGKEFLNKKGSLIADHVDVNIYNNTPENLVPSCHSCNSWRNNSIRVLDHEVFVIRPNDSDRDKTKNVRHRAEYRICKNCQMSFKHILSAHRKDQGQFCSRRCAAIFVCLKRHGIRDDEVFIVRPNGHRSRAEQRTCLNCQKAFLFDLAMRNFQKGEFCSPRCSNAYRNTGEKHFRSRFTDAQILEIRALDGQMTQRQIAERFQTSQPVVHNILRRKTRTNI